MSWFWICQGSEYARSSKYSRVLNIPLRNKSKFCFLKYKKVSFPKIKESSVSWNVKKNFRVSVSWNLRNFLLVHFFYLSSLDWKVQNFIPENIKKSKNFFGAGFFRKIYTNFFRKNFEGWDWEVQGFISGNIWIF